jgi:hypothetical protein
MEPFPSDIEQAKASEQEKIVKALKVAVGGGVAGMIEDKTIPTEEIQG